MTCEAGTTVGAEILKERVGRGWRHAVRLEGGDETGSVGVRLELSDNRRCRLCAVIGIGKFAHILGVVDGTGLPRLVCHTTVSCLRQSAGQCGVKAPQQRGNTRVEFHNVLRAHTWWCVSVHIKPPTAQCRRRLIEIERESTKIDVSATGRLVSMFTAQRSAWRH